MADSSNDIVLFRQIQKNDRLALNTLFAIYYQKLCRFANTFLNNHEEAEEAVSDVFVTLWKNRHSLTVERSLKAYLYVSVKHEALSIIKKRKLVFEDVAELTLDSVASASELNDAENQLAYEELKFRVESILDNLPPRCRQIFIMSRMDELKYSEISTILEISEKTVENQLIKALHYIRACLSEREKINNKPKAVT